MFIAIEGIDACGKGTQTELLAQRLEAKRFKFPDANTPIGRLIYAHLNKRWTTAPYAEVKVAPAESLEWPPLDMEYVDNMVFQSLQATNRLVHAKAIAGFLRKGTPVIADRYTASSLVYGGADGLVIEDWRELQEFLPQPDLNILLDIDLETSLERRPERRDRYETQDGYMAKVCGLYRQLWIKMRNKEGSVRWVIIDGRASTTEVAAEISVAVKACKVTMETYGG